MLCHLHSDVPASVRVFGVHLDDGINGGSRASKEIQNDWPVCRASHHLDHPPYEPRRLGVVECRIAEQCLDFGLRRIGVTSELMLPKVERSHPLPNF